MGSESEKCVDELLKQCTKIDNHSMRFQNNEIDENLIRDSRELIRSTQISIDNNKSIIPSYCLKKITDALRKLNNYVDEPQKKNLQFKFKSSKSSNPQSEESEGDKNDDNIQDHKPIEPINDLAYSTPFFGFRNQSNQSFQMQDVDLKDVSLINLINCQVEIYGGASTIYIRDLENTSVIVCLAFRSITIVNCYNCKFKLVCQQLRIDSSKNCLLETFSSAGSMLESSKEITFKCLEIKNLSTKAQEVFSKSGFGDCQNNWKSINDFDCLCESAQSKNYKILLE